MIIMTIFNMESSYIRVKQQFETSEIIFSNNINNLELLQENLTNIQADIAIIDTNIEFRSKAKELISYVHPRCKLITFEGNFDVLEINLKPAIQLVMMEEKNATKNISTDDNVKVVFVKDKDTEAEVKYVEKEVIKEVIKEVEKPVVVEKIVEKVSTFRSDAVITFLSNCSSGKSFLSWNVAYALSRYYKVAYINMDSANSANSYFKIDNIDEYPLVDIERRSLKELSKLGFRINDNLFVYTGRFGERTYINNGFLLKILNQLRAENNILIIDTASGYTDNLMLAINLSNDLVMVYDCDYGHVNLNDQMMDKVSQYTPIRPIAVVNNSFKESRELTMVRKHLKDSSIFKDIISINNCGKGTYDYIHTNTCNYLRDKSEFTDDLELLINSLKLQCEGDSSGVFSKLFNKFKRRKNNE